MFSLTTGRHPLVLGDSTDVIADWADQLSWDILSQSDGVTVFISREELSVCQCVSIQSPAVLRTVPSLRGAGHPHLSLGQTLRDQQDRGHRSWRKHTHITLDINTILVILYSFYISILTDTDTDIWRIYNKCSSVKAFMLISVTYFLSKQRKLFTLNVQL